MGLRKINDTTYDLEADVPHFEVEFGDIKQQDFFFRGKIKRWNNEVNFQIGFPAVDGGTVREKADSIEQTKDGITARAVPRRRSSDIIDGFDIIRLGKISPVAVCAEFELYQHGLEVDRLTAITYHPDQQHLIQFGERETKVILKQQAIPIPIVRAASKLSNISIFGPGIKIVDFHHPSFTQRERLLEMWAEAKIAAFKKLWGITVYQDRLKFAHRILYDFEGITYKLGSAEINYETVWDYINLSENYDVPTEYFQPGVDNYEGRPTRLPCIGIQTHYPQVTNDAMDLCVQELATQFAGQSRVRRLKSAEQATLTVLTTFLANPDWTIRAQRNDVRRVTKHRDALEILIHHTRKPTSREVVFSYRDKGGLQFDKQTPLLLQIF